MKEKNKKIIIPVVTLIVIAIVFGITYSFLRTTVNANRKVILSTGVLDLVLDEKNEITISDALPMYDEVGMIQEEVFQFSLINNTSMANDYTLKLVKIAGANELDPSIVKYGLIKEGEPTIALLSSLEDGVIDTGTITGGDTIEYELRLWIDNTVKNINDIQGKSLSYKLNVEAEQASEPQETERLLLTYNANTQVLDTKTIAAADAGQTFSVTCYKISDEVFTEEDLIGKYMIAVTATGEQRIPIVDGTLDDFTFENVESYGTTYMNEIVFFTRDLNAIDAEENPYTLTKGVWVMSTILTDFNSTELKLVEPIIDYGDEKIVFEWNKGDLILGTYGGGLGDLNRYSKTPLPRASELVGYKLIYEHTSGEIDEKILTSEDLAEEGVMEHVDFVVLNSVFEEGTDETNPYGWPLGVYLLASVEESDYVRITLMKP